LIEALREFYGLQAAPPSELFQFFVWEILAEHAVPARRDLAWHALRRLPALTPDAMARAPAKELLEAVAIAGPHREEKVERLRALAGEFKRHRDRLSHEALTRMTMVAAGRALSRLEHVSAASRARAFLFVVGRTVLPLDEDALRVIRRLNGSPHHRHRPAARRWLMERLQRDRSTYRDAVVYFRHHAQHTCLKAGPHCGVCPLRQDCVSSTRQLGGEAL
jgi:endonuclease III